MPQLHRLVFFIGGFDPKSAAHYHRTFRTAALRRPSSPAGEQLTVAPKRQTEGHWHHWEVRWQSAGAPRALLTRYGVWGWNDIVRDHWPRHLGQTLRDYLTVYGRAGAEGTLGRVRQASPATFWLSMFPLGIAVAAWGVGLGLGQALLAGLGQAGASLPAATGWAVGGLLGLGLWRWLENRLDAEWLLRLYAFTFAQARGQLPELEARLDDFADQLVAQAERAAQAGADDRPTELLVVGHSTGAILASSVVARALQRAPWLGTRGPQLALLTLGHCTPALAFQPPAHAFREELARLAACPQLCWVDYAAAADWASFAQLPPWLTLPTQGLKRQASPRFHQVLSRQRYAHLLKHRHELHLQYLREPDRSGGYDPVTLTSGAQTLAAQHAAPPGSAPAR